MPKVVDHDERRRAIAGALWRVVDRDGVTAVTMRSVARESGWSTGVVAHYFADMDELTAHSFRLVQERMAQRANRAYRRAADPREGVRAALAQALPLDTPRRREAAVWFGHLDRARHRPAVATVVRHHYERWRDELATQVEAAWPGIADASALADELIAVVDGLAVRALTAPRAPGRTAQLRLLDSALSRVDTARSG